MRHYYSKDKAKMTLIDDPISAGEEIFSQDKIFGVILSERAHQRKLFSSYLRGLDKIFDHNYLAAKKRLAVDDKYPCMLEPDKIGTDCETFVARMKPIKLSARNYIIRDQLAIYDLFTTHLVETLLDRAKMQLDLLFNEIGFESLFNHQISAEDLDNHEGIRGLSRLDNKSTIYINSDKTLRVEIREDGSWRFQKYELIDNKLEMVLRGFGDAEDDIKLEPDPE